MKTLSETWFADGYIDFELKKYTLLAYLQEQFPKKLTGLQLEKLQVLLEQMIEDDELMRELEEIINYATQEIQRTISNGTEIYEFVEDKLVIFPVGLVPLDSHEGYFFLSEGANNDTRVYQYRLRFFEKHDEKYRSIRTEYIDSWSRNLVNTYESIKSELIRVKNGLPNPAVYSIETELKFPVDETLLPIAKRSLVRYISGKAA